MGLHQANHEMHGELPKINLTEDFLSRHKNDLRESADTWSSSLLIPEGISDTVYPLSKIKEYLGAMYSEIDCPMSNDKIEVEAARQIDQTNTFLLVVAKYFSDNGLSDIKDKLCCKESNLYFFEEGYYHELFADCININEFNKHALEISKNISEAKDLGKPILHTLLEELEYDPKKLLEFFKDLINLDEEQYGFYKDELVNIVIADWSCPDYSQSQLRVYLDKVKNNPDYFVDSFANKVETDNKLRKILNMAKFALSFAIQVDPDYTVSDVLKATYKDWDSFEEIQRAFNNYSKDVLDEIEFIFGRKTKGSDSNIIRLGLDNNMLDQHKSKLFVRLGTNSRERRMYDRKYGGGLSKKNIECNDTQTSCGERPVERRTKLLKRSIIKGYSVVDMPIEGLLNDLLPKNKNYNGLYENMLRAVEALLNNPFNEAVSSLTDKRITIREGNRTKSRKKLMYLRLNRLQACEISTQYKSWRIVFVVEKCGDIAILSITDHDTFDDSY